MIEKATIFSKCISNKAQAKSVSTLIFAQIQPEKSINIWINLNTDYFNQKPFFHFLVTHGFLVPNSKLFFPFFFLFLISIFMILTTIFKSYPFLVGHSNSSENFAWQQIAEESKDRSEFPNLIGSDILIVRYNFIISSYFHVNFSV